MYELSEYTRYRYEPELDDGLLLLYNPALDEFRVADEATWAMIDSLDGGATMDRLVADLRAELDIGEASAEATAETVCSSLSDAGLVTQTG